MSSQEELATLIHEESDSISITYALVAAFALLAYDTLLTFPSEVKFIWHKKMRLGTILYLIARYSALLFFLLDIYLEFATFPSVQTTSLLFARAYAISSHHKLVFVVLALLGTTGIALSMQIIPVILMLTMLLLDTLNGVFVILFDTAVVVVILVNTYGILQLQNSTPELQRNSLSKLLAQQGISSSSFITREIKRLVRFVLTITLAGPITDKVLRDSLLGILGLFQNSLSAIIICHFHLDLQQRNHHPNGSMTSHSHPLNSFHAVTERIHRAVLDEFGDMSFNESFGTEGSQEDIELQAIQSSNGVAEINLQEFPWAGGDIGDEEAGPVASGEFGFIVLN
ncbi:hypothetical protein K439DRAFT_1617348 [Ramaria rubella]|nr:hypothetical protein K439DRAFT_1617348 [Ramaria rubella]